MIRFAKLMLIVVTWLSLCISESSAGGRWRSWRQSQWQSSECQQSQPYQPPIQPAQQQAAQKQAAPAKLNWGHDYNAAVDQGNAENKLVIAFFEAVPCEWCPRQDAQMNLIADQLKDYVLVKVMVSDANPDMQALSKTLGIDRFPSLAFIKPGGEPQAVYGLQPAGVVLSTIDKVMGIKREAPPPANKSRRADALDELNSLRVARGLAPFNRDEGLMIAARRAAEHRAINRINGHVQGGIGDFQFMPFAASAAAGGCSVRSPGDPFAACCAYEQWTFAGAASIQGDDGQVYHHLFVR